MYNLGTLLSNYRCFLTGGSGLLCVLLSTIALCDLKREPTKRDQREFTVLQQRLEFTVTARKLGVQKISEIRSENLDLRS